MTSGNQVHGSADSLRSSSDVCWSPRPQGVRPPWASGFSSVEMAPPSMRPKLTERQDVARPKRSPLLQSGGTLELRTRDRGWRARSRSCALELWRDPIRNSRSGFANSASVFSGWDPNGEAWWIFELMSEPVRLVVMPPDSSGGFSVGPGQSLLNPDRLLHLAGLLPFNDIDEETLGFDEAGRVRFVTVAESEGDWRRTRWHLDPKTLLPDELTALDDRGEVLATARLSGYEPIAARDLPIGAWPQFPRKVFLTLSTGKADLRLYFNRPSARGNGIRSKLFDLEQLIKSFRPGEVEYVSP